MISSLRIRLAVLTYKRPDALKTVLPALIDQAGSVDAHVEILVVDNDPAASAADFVSDVSARHPIVAYAHEAEPGISAGRNRALDESAAFDLLVFIDDDERPSAHWLSQLLAVYRAHGSAAVTGPVVGEYSLEPNAWISAGSFFSGMRRPTGTLVPAAATNNLLLDLRQLRQLEVRFDDRFGLTGGSDTLFTRQIIRRGGRIVWCDEAAVIDVVPGNRLTRQWILRKAFRMGNSWVRTSLVLASSRQARLGVRLHAAGRGAIRIVGGALRVVTGMLTGRLRLQARGMRTVARGTGMVAGSVGYVYAEYKRA